ncbi:hypothetical protein [Kitasatospora cineracea]|uniref:LIM zinc-binding domain-containing protein n=1 Tax=Kitasatospora cineracea TaxID=88074 RepID=A0A3N4R7K7_9ACTN|nr:hypothetical protein [Kitasatospora cineracea]RPE26601.1 hypothetical protein EDD38_7662 [Kitasatospora cineracea]
MVMCFTCGHPSTGVGHASFEAPGGGRHGRCGDCWRCEQGIPGRVIGRRRTAPDQDAERPAGR